MRITLFIGALGAGGAERALVVLAGGLQQRGHEVTVLTWINQAEEFYTVPEGVDHVRADIPCKVVSTRWFDIVGIMRRLYALRKSIKATNPDVVISFLDGNNEQFLLASIKEKYQKLLSVQIDIAEHTHFNRRWEKVRGLIYRWADKIVFLDQTQAERAQIRYPSWRCTGIPNPIVEVDTKPDKVAKEIITRLSNYSFRLVAMGRLANQKGFDLLLESFRKIIDELPQTGLVILGEGPLRADLEAQIEMLGLSEHVLMPGKVKTPHAIIAFCDVFVFSSRYEGQGLALVEAMACGVPAVSFDCPSGPSLIIRDHVDGVLVPLGDIDGFASSVKSLLHDKRIRNEMASQATKVRELYSVDIITEQWEFLFSQLM